MGAAMRGNVFTFSSKDTEEGVMVVQLRAGFMLVKSLVTLLTMMLIVTCGMFIRLRPTR